MPESLTGKRIAILATDGVEQVELTQPQKELQTAGATVEVVAPKSGEIKAWNHKDWGETIKINKTLDDVVTSDYDALVLPGGVINPDHLRTDVRAVRFVRDFFYTGKPIAAICHGPWTLVEANVVRGRKVTSWPSLKTDLQNAGAEWVDDVVIVDKNLITSRKPDDLPTFCRALMDYLTEAKDQGWKAA